MAERTQAWRDAVRYVAIDMCTIFKSAVRQAVPAAVLVADHFHIVQPANQAVTEIRPRVTVQVQGRRGRKGNRECELRNQSPPTSDYAPAARPPGGPGDTSTPANFR